MSRNRPVTRPLGGARINHIAEATAAAMAAVPPDEFAFAPGDSQSKSSASSPKPSQKEVNLRPKPKEKAKAGPPKECGLPKCKEDCKANKKYCAPHFRAFENIQGQSGPRATE